MPNISPTALTAELRTRFRALLWTWRVRMDAGKAAPDLPDAPTNPAMEDLAGDGEYEYRADLLTHALDTLDLRGQTDFEQLADDLEWAVAQPLPERWARDSRATSLMVTKARAVRERLRAGTALLLQLHRGADAAHVCPVCAAYDAMLRALDHEPSCDAFLLNPRRRGAGRPAEAWRAELRQRLRANGVADLIQRDLLQAVGLLEIPPDVRISL